MFQLSIDGRKILIKVVTLHPNTSRANFATVCKKYATIAERRGREELLVTE